MLATLLTVILEEVRKSYPESTTLSDILLEEDLGNRG